MNSPFKSIIVILKEKNSLTILQYVPGMGKNYFIWINIYNIIIELTKDRFFKKASFRSLSKKFKCNIIERMSNEYKSVLQ